MKPNRDASALADRLKAAASQPLPLPDTSANTNEPAQTDEPASARRPVKRVGQGAKKEIKEPPSASVPITLRPSKDLLHRYTLAAAERTRQEGKVISAQQIMLEYLGRGP
jgi:hypothetical protein